MSATVQTAIVIAIVLLAAWFVARRAARALRPARGAGCDHGCGCGDQSGEQDWSRTQ